jgi:hypothetical protein
MINGQEYAWEDISVTMSGQTESIEGIFDINYKVKRDVKVLHARGKEPYRIQRGKKVYTAGAKVYQSFLESLLRSAGKGRDITDLPPVTITIAYTPEDGGEVTTDVLTHVVFPEMEKGMGSEDTHSEHELPMEVGKTLYNV